MEWILYTFGDWQLLIFRGFLFDLALLTGQIGIDSARGLRFACHCHVEENNLLLNCHMASPVDFLSFLFCTSVCVWQDNCVFIWNFRYISLNGSVDFRLFCATIWFFPPWKAFDCVLLSYYSIAFVMGAELNSLLQQWLLPLCSFNKRVFIKQAFHTQCYGKCQLINSINLLACRT